MKFVKATENHDATVDEKIAALKKNCASYTPKWAEKISGVPASKIRSLAMEYAKTIAENAPLAVQAARQVMRLSSEMSEREALEIERSRAQELATTEDAVEGPRSFLEKRPPVFKGR